MASSKLMMIAVGMLAAGIVGGYVAGGALRPAATPPPPTVFVDPPGTVLAGGDEPKTTPCAWNDDPFEGVDAEERDSLTLVTACGEVKGTVADIIKVVEGEHTTYHFTLLPDSAYASMANAQNQAQLNGALMIEVEPQDQGLIPRLHIGEHLDIQGPHVTDIDHGWNEIHPAKIIAVL